MSWRKQEHSLSHALQVALKTVLKTKHDEPFTVAIRMTRESPFVQGVLTSDQASLSRTEAQLHGVPVPWNVIGDRGRKQTPDLSVLLG